jgi:hypothetical protein
MLAMGETLIIMRVGARLLAFLTLRPSPFDKTEAALTSSAFGRGTPGGRPLRRWCLIVSACALLSAASAPTAFATPITVGGYDFWGSIGLRAFSNPSYLAPAGGSGSSASNSSTPVAPLSGNSDLVSISGHIWVDIDRNGVWTPNEWPLPHVPVWLLSVSDPTFYQVTQTDLTGYYFFNALPPGEYQIHQAEMTPSFIPGSALLGQIVGGNSSGMGALGMVANPGHVVDTNTIAGLVLPPGYQATNYNFTETGLHALYASKRLFTFTPPVIPEPGTTSLLLIAALVAGAGRWRRRRAA